MTFNQWLLFTFVVLIQLIQLSIWHLTFKRLHQRIKALEAEKIIETKDIDNLTNTLKKVTQLLYTYFGYDPKTGLLANKTDNTIH